MATAGDKISFGTGIWCVSDVLVTTDIAEWDAEPAGTICEIISITATHSHASTICSLAVQDIANNFLINTYPMILTAPCVISYPAGARPRLNGLTVDTISGAPAATMTYSIVYRIVR